MQLHVATEIVLGSRCTMVVMLGPDEIADVEGDVSAFLRWLGAAPGTCPVELCECATGSAPIFSSMRTEGHYDGFRIELSCSLSAPRGRYVLGHELGHVWYHRIGYVGVDLEFRCDAFGAIVNMPRNETIAAIRRLGHSYTKLAIEFGVTQSVAFLRIGEVTGRPVCLLCPSGPIVRGLDYSWPSMSGLVRAIREPMSEVHPAKIYDEPYRVGLMARREAWSLMVA